MKREFSLVKLGAMALVLALLWRMIGAPVTAAQWRGLDSHLWQARVLLPGRMERVLLLWCGLGQPTDDVASALDQLASQEALELLGAETAQPLILQVWNAQQQRLEPMELERYVYGVVAAEMPAAYHEEALRAQAVAARTRAIYQQNSGGCSLAEGADVCTQSGHCQGYADTATLLEKWGPEAPLYQNRVVQAVGDTSGQIVTWQGEPILVMDHAISGGQTEEVQAVFAQPLPYLVSVDSPETEDLRGYREDAYFSLEEASQLLGAAFPDLTITPESLQRTLMVASHTATGRVESLLLSGSQVKATDFRSALGLRSTQFTFTMDGDGITFHQIGYGHGVGMSQAGANGMAASGQSYQQILSHYYPGTQLETYDGRIK